MVRRRVLLFALLSVTLTATALGQTLKVRVERDQLRVTDSQLRFLTGRPLDRLHNGATVTYALQLTIRNEKSGRVSSRLTQRFAFSYDLWEEKFTVTRLDSPARSASNLSIAKAQAWCLDNLAIPVAELPRDRPFWVMVEFESEETQYPDKEASSLTLSSLIDIFSRRSRDDQQVRGYGEAGPLSLNELVKKK